MTSATPTSSAPTKPATLFVVDDDPEICELLADYLGRHGYQVFTAQDADALRALMHNGSADLLIVDLMLPGDDGFSICREVRKHSEVPIIMLTASADETDRILGLELGADDYLGSPSTPGAAGADQGGTAPHAAGCAHAQRRAGALGEFWQLAA